MKKLFVSAALALAVVTSSFAGDMVKVDKKIQSAFQKEFASDLTQDGNQLVRVFIT